MSTSTGPHPAGPARARWIGLLIAKVLWSTTIVGADNVPATGPVILAANHTGVIDGPIVFGAAPRGLHLLIKEEMFHGLLGRFLRYAGQIPVDREGGRAALTDARTVLARGDAVAVFPEGNRGRGDASSARGGVAWLALNACPTVIPVAILGTRRTGEPVGHIPGLRRRLYVEFGTPLTIERAPGTTGRQAQVAASESIRVALADLVTGAALRSGISLPAD